MALVSYDYSSSEDEENESSIATEDIAESSRITLIKNDSTSTPAPKETISEDVTTKSPLFLNLPQTKTVKNVLEEVEDQIEDFIPKSKELVKDKQKVKITIPSLSDFNDVDDEPQAKKQKPSSKCSGLISLLPPVKGTITTAQSFVPNVVNKKKSTSSNSNVSKSSGLVPNVIRKKAEAKRVALIQRKQKKQQQGSDIESDDDIEMPETFDDEMWEKVCGRPKPKVVIQEPEKSSPQEIIDIAPEPERPYEGLDNKAFKELVGKNKRPIGNIKLIDINEEEILPEKDIWMTKSLTDPEMVPKANVEDPVDPTRRKKHHITYLAQQAKANEQELQSAWAASKNNRLASRAKYGF